MANEAAVDNIHIPESVVFTGDRANPFSLMKHSDQEPESWISDFSKADITCQKGVVAAVNRETQEKIPLILIKEKWIPAGKNTGSYSIQLKDISGGLVLGGSLYGVFNSGRISGKSADVFIHAFSFGIHDVTAQTEYQAGASPLIIYSLSDADEDVLAENPTGDRLGTVVFRDGNVLKFTFVQYNQQNGGSGIQL